MGFDGSLELLVDRVLQNAIPAGSDDDTALLAVRWLS
jgi:hypothetical protein